MKSRLKKSKPYMEAFALNFALAVCVFGFYMLKEKGIFTLSYDFNSQIIPFSKLTLDSLHDKSGLWNWSIDLGSDLLSSMGYYTLGSPFFWLFSWCSSRNVLYVVGWEYILKYAVAGVASYAFLRRYAKNNIAALTGSILYAFSGFQTNNLMYMIFHDAVALFPFLLIAFEELIENDRRGWFALTVCINAVVNYYLFLGEVVFLILYFILKYCLSDIKKYIGKMSRCLGEGVLGIAMSCAILLPSLYNIVQSERVTNGLDIATFFTLPAGRREILKTFVSIVFPGEMAMGRSCVYGEEWSSKSLYLPMIGIIMVMAYLLKKQKEKWLKRVLIALILLTILPFGNGLFSLFTTDYCRWYYMVLLLFALASVKVMDDLPEYPIKSMAMLVTIIIGVQYIVFHWWDKNRFELVLDERKYMILSSIAFFGALLTMLICLLHISNNAKQKLFLLGIGVFAVITTSYVCNLYQKFDGMNSIQVQNKIKSLNNLQVEDNVRYYVEEDNIGMYGKFATTNSFISTICGSIPEFWESLGLEKLIFSPEGPRGTKELLSVKYKIVECQEEDGG